MGDTVTSKGLHSGEKKNRGGGRHNEEGLALMGSDTNLMVKAKMACKSNGLPWFSFVRPPGPLIKSLLDDTAWRRLYSQ